MRYREGQQVDPDNPYGQGTQATLEFTYWLAIPIGIVLLWMGLKGRIIWLIVWSIGLILISVGLLIFEYLR